MRKLEKMIAKYGLGWYDMVTVESFNEKLNKQLQRNIDANHYKEMKPQYIQALAESCIDVIFNDLEQTMVIRNKEKFIEHNGRSESLSIFPVKELGKLELMYEVHAKGVQPNMYYGFASINQLRKNRNDGAYSEFYEYVSKNRNQKNQMKVLFDTKQEEKVIEEEIVDLLTDLDVELLNGRALEELRQEMQSFFEEWLTRKIRKPKEVTR